MTPEVLTTIYGQEDWHATIKKVEDAEEEGAVAWARRRGQDRACHRVRGFGRG